MPEKVRPSKKQQELLRYIESFVSEHGYGPSYREIMQGKGYKSVATVAAHVNNLIAKGQLRKKDRSARSLELVSGESKEPKIVTNVVKPAQEKWLVDKIDLYFRQLEAGQSVSQHELDGLYVLVGSLKVLGLEGAAKSFIARLSEIKKRAP